MKILRVCIGLLVMTGSVNSACAAVHVSFDQAEYVVSSIGESFDVQVLIDADDQTPGLDPIPRGLFSFGSEIQFDGAKAHVDGINEIDIASALNHFGASLGGLKKTELGRAAGKGNIDQFQNPLVPYADSLLMTLTLTNNAAPVDEYPLELDFFRTLGATEDLFVDGAGSVLDDEITFGTATVRVVPEPSTLLTALLAILGVFFSRRQKCPASGR